MKKTRRKFSDAEKRAAVDEYVNGRKKAAEVAASIGIAVGLLYKWRVMLAEAAKGERIDELERTGSSPSQARRIVELEEQIAEYQKKVGEQSLIIDLLKKLQPSGSSQPASELTGLIETTRSSRLKRKQWK